jgi:hypothetical protein
VTLLDWHACTLQDTDKTETPVGADGGAPHAQAGGLLGGKGSDEGAGRPSARWSIPAAPNPTSGTAVKLGRREAWARFLAYEVLLNFPLFPWVIGPANPVPFHDRSAGRCQVWDRREHSEGMA